MQKKIGLRVANKPDSQDICFVPDGNYAEFIEETIEKKIPEGILCCRMELLSEDIKELPITQLDRGRDLVCRLDILFLSGDPPGDE